jgi:hypothetical protein
MVARNRVVLLIVIVGMTVVGASVAASQGVFDDESIILPVITVDEAPEDAPINDPDDPRIADYEELQTAIDEAVETGSAEMKMTEEEYTEHNEIVEPLKPYTGDETGYYFEKDGHIIVLGRMVLL